MTDVVSMSTADLERMMDRMALDEGMIDPHAAFEAVADAVDGEVPEGTDELGPEMATICRLLLQLRISDEKAFDLLCLKVLCPDMTHADMLHAMQSMDKASWSHRGRCSERLSRLVERFPQLEGVLIFDRRGGARNRRVTGSQLDMEYGQLKAAEMERPHEERRPCEGEEGLYHVLAERYGIRGILGKPSWQAVKMRIYRARQKWGRCSRDESAS